MCEDNKTNPLNKQHTLNLGISNNRLSGKKNQNKICKKSVNSSNTTNTEGVL